MTLGRVRPIAAIGAVAAIFLGGAGFGVTVTTFVLNNAWRRNLADMHVVNPDTECTTAYGALGDAPSRKWNVCWSPAP